MPHLLVLIPFGRAGGSYLLPSFVLVPVRVGGLFLALGLLSRQGECAFALFLRPIMLFPARHACFNFSLYRHGVKTSSSSSVS